MAACGFRGNKLQISADASLTGKRLNYAWGDILDQIETMSWKKVKLGEYVDFLTGFPFKSSLYSDDKDSIKLLRGDNVAQGYLRWEGVKRWILSDSDDFTKYWLEKDDVILAMDRPWIEAGLKYAWVKEGDLSCLLVQRVTRMRGAKGLLTNYLRYIIADQSFTDYIKPIVTGVCVPHISPSQIQDYTFQLPPIEVQLKITAILSAYDNLIENNTRRIRILEDMAQAFYREWFVEFRFPGHEKVKMVESELGMVPEGWNVKILGDLTDINTSSIKKGNELKKISYIDIASVSTGQIDSIKLINFIDAPSRARRIVKHGDIIWSTVHPNRKSYSIILRAAPNLIVSTGFAVITAKLVPYTYLYHALTTDDFVGYLTNHASGSAYPAVNSGDFNNAYVLLPPNTFLQSFHNIVSDLFENKQNMLEKNDKLRRTRNLLLPKLISGELDVNDLSIDERT